MRVGAYWLMVWLALAPLIGGVSCSLTCAKPTLALCCAQESHEHLSGTPTSTHECPSCVICHPAPEQPAVLTVLEWAGQILLLPLERPTDFLVSFVALPVAHTDEVSANLLLRARLYLRAPPPSEPA